MLFCELKVHTCVHSKSLCLYVLISVYLSVGRSPPPSLSFLPPSLSLSFSLTHTHNRVQASKHARMHIQGHPCNATLYRSSHTQTNTHTRTLSHTHERTHARTRMRTHVHTHDRQAHTGTCMGRQLHARVRAHAHTYTHTNKHTHVLQLFCCSCCFSLNQNAFHFFVAETFL